LARRTVAWGNAIGSHTWKHELTTLQTPTEIAATLRADVAVWWRLAHATPVPYFRPPYGGYDDETLAAAGSAGFARVILWSVDPADWGSPGSAVIADRVLSHVHPGAIVLMHVTPGTAAALPTIISGLRARGYSMVTLPALFRAAGYR
jgi:peptidoglycan-N-acetylglucosamine deacetylase